MTATSTYPFTMDELAIELSASAPELFELPAEHYLVLTGRSAEALLCVYKGADREAAAHTADFWDERQNTYFFSVKELVQTRDALPTLKKIDIWVNEALARIGA